jgi:hypothetical protein
MVRTQHDLRVERKVPLRGAQRLSENHLPVLARAEFRE